MADKQSRDQIVSEMRAKDSARNQAIWQALKRTPGLLAGGTVDAANVLLGLITGKGFEGLVKKPIGGGESINEVFGMPKGTNATQDIAEAVMSMLSPSGMAKAIILPAAMAGTSIKNLRAAQNLIDTGKSKEAYDKYKIFIPEHPAFDGVPLQVIDDSKNRLTSNRLIPVPGQESDLSIKMLEAKGGTPESFVGDVNRDMYDYASLGNLLNAPELYAATSKLVPDLKTVPVVSSMYNQPPIAPGTGYYYPGARAIGIGPGSPFVIHSNLLHEVQHIIAEAAGLPAGMPGGHRSVYGGKEITDKFLSAKKQTDKLPSSDPRRQAMQNASEEAFAAYMTDPGEVLSRVTQRMFETGDYSISPNTLMSLPELTPSIFMGPPRTLSSEVQQIIKQFTPASKP